jgi:hypothetical protein
MVVAQVWGAGTSGRARVAATFATTLLTALVALSLQASPALASEGCTYTNFPNKYVCFGIVGKSGMASNYVDHFYVRRGKLASGDNGICNYRARVTVRSPSGYVWTYWSPTRWGCTQYRASRDFYVRGHYPKGSYACGTWYENGVYIDKACNYIR